jgi:hypothetical protein
MRCQVIFGAAASLKVAKVPMQKVLYGVFAAIALEIAILSTWTAVSPPSFHRV